MDNSILPQLRQKRNPTPAVTTPFDQDEYPISLTATQAAIVAFAREQANGGYPVITTRLVAEHFGLTLNAAYKRLRRLRDKGIFYSQLLWITRDNGSRKAVSRDENGKKRLYSWLELYLRPMTEWGQEPDQVQKRFDPRNHKQKGATR
jgi:DNA-binding transcriptional regulator YhcF (GntR family)